MSDSIKINTVPSRDIAAYLATLSAQLIATGQQLIDAYVTQVLTTVPPQTQTASPPRCWR